MNLITEVASHELFEAATDPLPFTSPAYNRLDGDHYAWGFVFLSEGGDLCVQADELTVKPDDIGFSVQRMWSNAYAKLGHDPCVPAVKNTTYFNSAPVLADTLTFDDQGQRVTTKGLRIPVGSSKTIDVQLFSDGPSGLWSVTAVDPSSLRGGEPSPLSFAFDRTTGKNGDVLRLTITRSAGGAGFDAFMLQSKLGTERHFWPGFVGD